MRMGKWSKLAEKVIIKNNVYINPKVCNANLNRRIGIMSGHPHIHKRDRMVCNIRKVVNYVNFFD